MIGAGVPSLLIVLLSAAAVVAALAWPVMAFMAMRALTRIADSLERMEKR